MGAGASVAFGLGVAFGAAWGGASRLTDAAFDALDAVDTAAEAVMEYLRLVKDAACSAAAWAMEKLEEAARIVLNMVVRLLRRLLGRKKAAAARREMRRAGPETPDVFTEAAARVARSGRCIMAAPATSSAVVVVPAAAAAAPGGKVSGSDVARRAARSAAGMMSLILEAFAAEADVGDSIPAAARSSITIIAAAAAVCLDVVAATDANA